MKSRVMTQNSMERSEVKWDGERFWLFQALRDQKSKIIIWNPVEALALAEFIIETLKGEKANAKTL